MKKLLLCILSILATQKINTHQTQASKPAIVEELRDTTISMKNLLLNELLQHFMNNMAYIGAQNIRSIIHDYKVINPAFNSILKSSEHPILFSGLLRHRNIKNFYNKIVSLIQNNKENNNLPSKKTKLLAGLLSILTYTGCTILGSLSFITLNNVIQRGLYEIWLDHKY